MKILITGASSGIGRETARYIGTSVECEIGVIARRSDRLQELVPVLQDAGQTCRVFPIDVTDAEACRRTAKEFFCGSSPHALEEAGFALVNAAGVAEFGDFASMATQGVLSQIGVNLMGALNMCQAVLPSMLERGSGTIINVGSMAAVNTLPGSVAYTASKAGLHAASKVMAAEYRRKGIRVVSLLIGAVDTELWDPMSFVPPRQHMLPARAVAETILDLILMPKDRAVDEMLLMPPNGIL